MSTSKLNFEVTGQIKARSSTQNCAFSSINFETLYLAFLVIKLNTYKVPARVKTIDMLKLLITLYILSSYCDQGCSFIYFRGGTCHPNFEICHPNA